jgi:hypothetical protein
VSLTVVQIPFNEREVSATAEHVPAGPKDRILAGRAEELHVEGGRGRRFALP